MTFFTRAICVIALCGGSIALDSLARNPDGTLALLRTPNNGVPVIIDGEGHFEVLAEEEATLSLSGASGRIPLTVSWSPRPGGLHLGQCVATTPLPAGAYALQAETVTGSDTNMRSVYVVEDFPDQYQIAHITDTHIGSTRHPRAASAIIQDIIETVNASEASFALITGDLTENGEVEQFQRFLEVLDRCLLPTYVVAGNHDRQARNYELFFGPQTYAFTFGEDGYLGFDTKDFLIADEMGVQDGLLHYYRRQIRASRWSIGFTHRYDITMGMRAQLSLFVDDPLDCLLYGHYHREADAQDGVPWGHTDIIMTPAAINGMLRFVVIDAKGVQAQETITAAALQIEGE